MRLTRRIALIHSLLFGLMSCGPTVESVHIDRYSLERKPVGNLTSVIGQDVEAPLFRQLTADDFILVNLVVDRDLRSLAAENGFSLSTNIEFCEPTSEEFYLGDGLYLKGKRATQWNIDASLSGSLDERVSSAQFEYQSVVFSEWKSEWPIPDAFANKKPQLYFGKYDLTEDPKSVCVNLIGGNPKTKIVSNTIAIPREEVMRILSQ